MYCVVLIVLVLFECLYQVDSRHLLFTSSDTFSTVIKKIVDADKNEYTSLNVPFPPKSIIMTYISHTTHQLMLELQLKAFKMWSPSLLDCSRFVIAAANKEAYEQCTSNLGLSLSCVLLPQKTVSNNKFHHSIAKYELIAEASTIAEELFYIDPDVLLFQNPWVADMGLFKLVDSKRVEPLYDLMFQRDRGTLGNGAADFDCHPLDVDSSVLYARNTPSVTRFIAAMIAKLGNEQDANTTESGVMLDALKSTDQLKACGLNPYMFTSSKQAYAEGISDGVPVGQIVSFHFHELQPLHRRIEFMKVMLERVKNNAKMPLSDLFTKKEYASTAVSLGEPLMCNKNEWEEVLMIEKGSNTLVLRPTLERMGNLLSQYYNARGFAKYLGVCFRRFPFPPNGQEWLDVLPTEVCPSVNSSSTSSGFAATAAAKDVIDRFCAYCHNVRYPHECEDSFFYHMVPEMRVEINAAMLQYAEKMNIAYPTFDSGGRTSVIYSRCWVSCCSLCFNVF